jgi:hypothetical protein
MTASWDKTNKAVTESARCAVSGMTKDRKSLQKINNIFIDI